MAGRGKVTTTFDAEQVIQPIYTGGSIALDADGRVLATCLGDEAVLTDINTGELLARVEGDGEALTALAITPTCSHLLTCSRSLSMKIYALNRHDEGPEQIGVSLERTLKPHTTPVTVVAVDETGTLLATGGADSTVKVFDIRGGYVTHTFRGHNGVISAVHFFDAKGIELAEMKAKRSKKNPHNESEILGHFNPAISIYLASGAEDGKIRIWSLAKRKSVALLDSHSSAVTGFDFSDKNKCLASASRDRTVVVWDSQTWKPAAVLPVLETVESVCFLQSGKFIAIGGERGVLRIWETERGTEITKDQDSGNDGDGIIQLVKNKHHDFVLSIHNDQSLVVHDTQPLGQLTHIEPLNESLRIIRRISGTHDEVIDMVYADRNQSLLALATNSENVRLISLSSTQVPRDPKTGVDYFGADITSLVGHEEIVICITVDWSGHWLATGAKDNTARIWRIDRESGTYDLWATCTGHAESIGAISFPSLVPPADSTSFRTPLEHPPPFLLTGSQDRTIKQWAVPKTANHASRADYTRKAHDKDINAIAISPTSRLFASASQDRTVKIWSVQEGETQGVLRGHKRGVWSVAFAPTDAAAISSEDGTTATNRGMVLTGSGDKTIKIWSLNDYSCLRTFEGHTNSVLKVLWLPPSPLLSSEPPSSTADPPTPSHPRQDYYVVSAAGDGLVKVWEPSSGESLATLDNHTDRVWALTQHKTDHTLVSGGGDGVITFWKNTSSQTAAARDKAATERVEQDQDLLNRIHRQEYRQAITLALALDHPARLLGLFQAVILDNEGVKPSPRPSPDNNVTTEEQSSSITGSKDVDEVIASLNDTQLLSLLKRVRDWNTNARTCTVAQRILNVVVRRYPAGRLAALGKRKGGKEVVEALRVYTERHYQRIEELWGESWIVEFLLGEMGSLMGEDGEVDGDVEMVNRKSIIGTFDTNRDVVML